MSPDLVDTRLHQSAGPEGSFCISLDFELMWGVRDKRTIDQYGANVLGGRDAVEHMLEAFEKRKIRATWATVGMLFCETKDELHASLPELKPSYENSRLSNYGYMSEVGDNETSDPYHFAASLVKRLQSCPGQEIATHTFSHYYCLEPGQTQDQFAADLDAAVAVAARRGITFKSIVFPRNQYNRGSVDECAKRGIKVYRGNETGWIYRPSAAAEQTLSRRATRLIDAYVDLSGANCAEVSVDGGVVNVPSSRFLRPYSRRLSGLEPFRLKRIKKAMTKAARQGGTFHLWWHPHNLGVDLTENLAALSSVLDHFDTLRAAYGMRSLAMADFATSLISARAK